jgi:hypothetical protein
MKNKKYMYHTLRTDPKSNEKIIEIDVKSIQLKHIYLTDHFPGLLQTLQ